VRSLLAFVLLLFAATAGPELLCPDRRQNVLALIFTRPVTRSDYLLAKHVRHLDIRTTSFGHRAMFTPECVAKLVGLVEPQLDAHESTPRA